MELDPRPLTAGERRQLRQIVRAKAGVVTVREARHHVAPTGGAFIFEVVGVTALALGLSLLFLPFLLVAAAAPIILPLRQHKRQARWKTLLPPERDAEPFSLGA